MTLLASACAAPYTPEGLSSLEMLPTPTAPEGTALSAANWKERLDQPYVFLEVTGDHAVLGAAFEQLHSELRALGIRPVDAPFALFFTDPGVQADPQRARACCPVRERPARAGSLQYELLQRAMVVYARVPGAHVKVTRAYPALFSYLHGIGGRQCGPVREVYLENTRADGVVEAITEIQIPWSRRSD